MNNIEAKLHRQINRLRTEQEKLFNRRLKQESNIKDTSDRLEHVSHQLMYRIGQLSGFKMKRNK